MMACKKTRLPFLDNKILRITGIVLVLILAISLLWYGNTHSMQSTPAMMAQVYFDGEYRVADGPWQTLAKGKHIPSTKGDVVLRGNFHLLAPDGSYEGLYTGELSIALFVDHLSLTFCEGENPSYTLDMENPLYGASACGEMWVAWHPVFESTEPMEIIIHNPHSYGNETAIDTMLSGVTLWTGADFEKTVLNSGESQREMALFFVIVSLMLLGTALFSTLIHTKNTKIIWLLGSVILFAGAYLSYSADGISLRSESIVSNTVILGCSMMLYMLFLLIAIVELLKTTKPVGKLAVSVLAVVNGIFFALPMLTQAAFYDLWLYWVITQGVANAVLLVCLIKEICVAERRTRWLYAGLILPLVSFGLDTVMTGLGLWKGGLASKYVFIVLFVAAMFSVLRIIPQSINALTKAKELETERAILNAQLTESRVSTMMSQIRPHFIYNTLGSIEQLCEIDPEKAGELVHNFAKYLRGNFGELDNPRPIHMSQEMEHVQYYISIEKVRFPDMTFHFEMNSVDFCLPALTIQPLVENAVKHGLMKRDKGGVIRVISYETDTHYCVLVEDDGAGFDIGVLQEDRKHMGIRNIRERLKAMVSGTVEIESTLGVGTKVLITIPKEAEK